MIRITLIEIASFLLRFLLFFIWRWQTQADVKLTATPALKLALVGAAFAIVVMVAMALIDSARGGHEGDQYVPPRLVDGEVVPGHFARQGEDDDLAEDETPEATPGDTPQ